MGFAFPHFRTVGQIPLRAGARLYAARRAGRAAHCAARLSLRFHLFPHKSEYVRGVGFDVFETFRKTMSDLGWVMQIFCDHRMLAGAAPYLREVSRQMPVIVDHLGMVPAIAGVEDTDFQALLKLVGDGHVHVKLSAVYRLSGNYPDYPAARPFHDALVRANPERLMWGTDWPHPSIAAAVMPDDGHLLDLFHDWTSDRQARRRILVDTPARLFAT
ncbi:MAG: amidohydrolase family protein [Xanthobacteraceae bacterium]